MKNYLYRLLRRQLALVLILVFSCEMSASFPSAWAQDPRVAPAPIPAVAGSPASEGASASALPDDPEPAPAGFEREGAQGAEGTAQPVPVKGALSFQENFSLGIELSRQGNHRDAVGKFRAAYAIKPLPVLYLYLGLSYQKLGIIKVAVGYYKLYLRFESNIKPEIRAEVESYIREQQSRLDEEERALRAVRESGGEGPATDVASAKPGGAGIAITDNSGSAGVAPVKPAVPIYKRWWFWGTIGGVVAAGVVGGAVGGTRSTTPEPPTGVPVINLPW